MHRTRGARIALCVAFLALVAALLPSAATLAVNPIVVTTTTDEFAPATGDTGCSLREAVEAANTDAAFGGCHRGSGADTIKLGPHRYVLTIPPGVTADNRSGDLNVTQAVTVLGASSATTRIDGDATDRIFFNASSPLTLKRMTLLNGNTDGDGGAIYQEGGTMTAVGVVVSGNTSTGYGGGIYAAATNVGLHNVVLSGNHGGSFGGGLFISGAGGGATQVTIDSTSIVSNAATGNGGGIFTEDATLTVTRSLLTRNHAIDGDGILSAGSGTVKIFSSTITNNGNNVEGGKGGGIRNYASMTLVNVTISANLASNAAGDGGNIYNTGTLVSRDTLMGEALSSGDCGGSPITSHGYNLEYAIFSSQPCFSGSDPTDVFGDPKLGALADNGGPTMTQALGPGSAAINAGVTVSKVITDQRGVPRPAGPKPDIGAYERAVCHGILVNIVGTLGNDTLTGTSGSDGMLALGGSDLMSGGAGRDGLCGGPGNDRLSGGGGNDGLDGGAGNDGLSGGSGNDDLFGGTGVDTCAQGSGSGLRSSCEH
jgi:CSLREA domain-containing protein